MSWWLWALLGVLALAGESVTMALFLLNVGIAAFVAAALAALHVPELGQVGVFVLLAVVLIGLVRPRLLHALAQRRQPAPLSMPEALAHRVATVTEPVTDVDGLVRVGKGEFWTARSLSSAQPISVGSLVRIARVEGLTAYVEPIATAPGSPAAPSGSELHAFLIADVRGFTHFSEERGDAAAAGLALRFASLVREGVAARGGQLLELRGDEALVVFGSVRQALHAALELQAQFAAATVADPTLPLGVGMGLEAGEALAVEAGYRGRALNLAARLCSVAGPGEVLASEAVVHLAGPVDGLIYRERGRVALKGVGDPVRVLQVLPEGVGASGSLPAPLQGVDLARPRLVPTTAFGELQPPTFGHLLRSHRLAANLTQEALARRGHISTGAISALERGVHHTPQHETVQLLAEALQLSAHDRAAFEDAARRLTESTVPRP